MINHKNNTATGKSTYYRPPSCDKPVLKECPFCGDQNIFKPTAPPYKLHCYRCEAYGPWYDRHGDKWNSIPRRSEVAELLRLVYELHRGPMGQESQWEKKRKNMLQYAERMRKEWGL